MAFNWSWVRSTKDTLKASASIEKGAISLTGLKTPDKGILKANELKASIDSANASVSQVWRTWTNIIKPILDSLPAGARDNRWKAGRGLPAKIDAQVYGIQGTTLFVFNDATSAVADGRYWHASEERPKTIAESIDDLWTEISSFSTSGTNLLEAEIEALKYDIYNGYVQTPPVPLDYSIARNIDKLLKIHGITSGWRSNPDGVNHDDVGGGGTLDTAYDFGGAGAGRTITADTGAVEITVPDTSNTPGLIIDQNDSTNNQVGLLIKTIGACPSIELEHPDPTVGGSILSRNGITVGAVSSTAVDATVSLFCATQGGGIPRILITSDSYTATPSSIHLIAKSTGGGSAFLDLTSEGRLAFIDEHLTSIITLSQPGNTGLSGFTATSIVGALNELKSEIGSGGVQDYSVTWDQEITGSSSVTDSISITMDRGMLYSVKIETIAGTAPSGADLELADAVFSGSHELLYQIGSHEGVARWKPDVNPTWKDRNPVGVENLTGTLYWRLTNEGLASVTFRVTIRACGVAAS